MRKMPSVIHDPITGEGIELPCLVAGDWSAAVVALVGRTLTEQEKARVTQCYNHNWSVRVTAEDILGRSLTAEEVQERKTW